MIDSGWTRVEYRGVTFLLRERSGQWEYRLSKYVGGFAPDEGAARKAAKAAVDRKLEREAVK